MWTPSVRVYSLPVGAKPQHYEHNHLSHMYIYVYVRVGLSVHLGRKLQRISRAVVRTPSVRVYALQVGAKPQN